MHFHLQTFFAKLFVLTSDLPGIMMGMWGAAPTPRVKVNMRPAPKPWQPTMPPATTPAMLPDMPSLGVQPRHSVAAYIPPGFMLVPMDQAPARKPSFANRQALKLGKGKTKGKGKMQLKGGKGTKSVYEVTKGKGKLKDKGDGAKGKGKKGKGKSKKGKTQSKPADVEDVTLEVSPNTIPPEASTPSKKSKKAAKKEKTLLPGSPVDMNQWVTLAITKGMQSSGISWLTRKGKVRVKNFVRDLYIQHGSGKTRPDDTMIVAEIKPFIVKEEAKWNAQQQVALNGLPIDGPPNAEVVLPADVTPNAAVATPTGVEANSEKDVTMEDPAADSAEHSAASSDEEKPPTKAKAAPAPKPGRSKTWVAEIPMTDQEKQSALMELNFLTDAIRARAMTRSEFIWSTWNLQGIVFANRYNGTLLQVSMENEPVYAASVPCQEHADMMAKDKSSDKVDKDATEAVDAEMVAAPPIAPVTPVKLEVKDL